VPNVFFLAYALLPWHVSCSAVLPRLKLAPLTTLVVWPQHTPDAAEDSSLAVGTIQSWPRWVRHSYSHSSTQVSCLNSHYFQVALATPMPGPC
jgi:hypothetical protein